MSINYSVIVPFRDKYDLFIKAVGSVPDRDDIQVIIIDNSPVPLDSDKIPIKNESLITYAVSSPTKGAGRARNVGLTCVQGKFVLFLDADDYFAPNAFQLFDSYLDSNYDIVFFKSNSLNLVTGKQSTRHHVYNNSIDYYLSTGCEDRIRFRFEPPWGKLYRSCFILSNPSIRFEEVKVNNDAWFSLMAGYNAGLITASKETVYIITEGGNGSSLTKSKSFDNILIRYKCAIKTNTFLKKIGHNNQRIRLLGFIRLSLQSYGISKAILLVRIAVKNRVTIF